MAVIFIFLDGVGLAPAGPDNPLTEAPTHHLHKYLGGPLVQETVESLSGSRHIQGLAKRMLFTGIDATLGVEGLPQSGTGQTALLAGVNAPRLHGRHQPHVPPVALRPLLAEQNILRMVIQEGGRATFANAFTPGYWDALARRRIRRSASVIAAEGAGVRFRDLDDLRKGEAVSWDITGAALSRSGVDIAPIRAEEAGAAVLRLARSHELVFYENFLPDLTGHGRSDLSINDVFGLIDAMLGSVIAHLSEEDTLVVTSDHGNIESFAAPTHTRNPVPLLVVGRSVRAFDAVRDISEVAGAITQAARR